MTEPADTEIVQPDSPSAQDFVQEGDRLFRQEQWDDAVASYQQAIALQPEWVLALCKIGKALMRQERWNDAARQFEQAIELNSASHLANYGLAQVAIGQESWAAAVDTLTRTIELKPGFVATAYVDLGDVLQHLQRWDESISAYCAALRCGAPDKVYDLLATALCNRAMDKT